MGYISKNLYLVYKNHKIEVEAITGMFFKDEYSLIIDGKRVDTVHRMLNAVLRGQLVVKEGQQPMPIKVEVKKNLLTYLSGGQIGLQAFVEIEGQKYLMKHKN